MKFKQPAIKKKFIIPSIVTSFIFIVAIGVSTWKNIKVFAISNETINERVPTSLKILSLQEKIDRTNSYLIGFQHTSTDVNLQKINSEWKEEITPLIEELKLSTVYEKNEKLNLLMNSLMINLTAIYYTQQEIVSVIGENKTNKAELITTVIKSKLVPQTNSIKCNISDIISIENSNIKANLNTINRIENEILWLSIASIVIGTLVLIGYPYIIYLDLLKPIIKIKEFIQSVSKGNIPSKLKSSKDEWKEIYISSNKLIENLENVKTFATEVGNGKFETNINVFNNEGELGGSLAEMKNSLIKVAEEDKKRNWGTNGIAQMGEILRKSNNEEDLYNEIINFLVKYLNVNQGGLFLLNSENKADIHLELVACYAFNKRKYINKRIEIGEGLVGQCVLEKDIIHMTEVPKDYVAITSGLGDGSPRCILIVPLNVNEEILGVIEIASFKTLQNHEIEFVKKIGESIASTISNVKINIRTKTLLDNSQQMTEQLRAQEEEMRQNVEELQATQEEMYRKQIEMDGQMSAINSIYLFTEFDIDGYIIHANELFLKTFKYTLDEIRRQNHTILLETNTVEFENHKEFWTQLRNGKNIYGEFKRITKEGNTVCLVANYTPIFDKSGELIKVIKLASNITSEKNSNLDLNSQIEAVGNSFAKIEFNNDGCIAKVNSVICSIMEYEEKELIGRHHNLFVDSEFKKTQEYRDFWKDLCAGKNVKGRFKRVKKNGECVWLNGIYSPVIDLDSKTIKIIGYFNSIIQAAEEVSDLTNKENSNLKEKELRRNLEELKVIQEDIQQKNTELNKQISSLKERSEDDMSVIKATYEKKIKE